MGGCRVVELHEPASDPITLAACAHEFAATMEDFRSEKRAILTTLDAAFPVLDRCDPMRPAFRRSVPAAPAALRAGLGNAGSPVDVTLHALADAHMDIACLWPVGQMPLETARTCSDVPRMMELLPDHRPGRSQPRPYDDVRREDPEIIEAIRARRRGPVGGMWVEPDTTLPGGGALVRLLLLGRRPFAERLEGDGTSIPRLPDTFGLARSPPQIVARAGLTSMVVNEASWNQCNQFPTSKPWWEGIDGARVLTQSLTTPRGVQHLPCSTSCKSDLTAEEVVPPGRRTPPRNGRATCPPPAATAPAAARRAI